MEVQAIRTGYYNHRRRRPGDVFKLVDKKAFSAKWMERVEATPSKPAKPVESDAPIGNPSQEVI